MTELSTDPVVLAHVAITLIAIASGLYVLWSLLMDRLPAHANQVFLLFTFLTSATGLIIAPALPPPRSPPSSPWPPWPWRFTPSMPATWPGAGGRSLSAPPCWGFT